MTPSQREAILNNPALDQRIDDVARDLWRDGE